MTALSRAAARQRPSCTCCDDRCFIVLPDGEVDACPSCTKKAETEYRLWRMEARPDPQYVLPFLRLVKDGEGMA